MIKAAGVQAVGVDLTLLRREEEDGLAESVEAGLGILAGAVPATAPSSAERDGARPPEPAVTARRVVDLWRRMGWPGRMVCASRSPASMRTIRSARSRRASASSRMR